MSYGQLISEKTKELENGFRDRWQRNRSTGKIFRDWDCLPEREHERNEKCTEEASIILLVQVQEDSQWQQQTWIWWKKTLFYSEKYVLPVCGIHSQEQVKCSGELKKNCLGVLHASSRNHSQTRRKKFYLKEWSYKLLLFRELDWWGSTGNWNVTVQPPVLSLKLALMYDIKLGQMRL